MQYERYTVNTRGAGQRQASDLQPGSVAGRVTICGTELTNQNASRCPAPSPFCTNPCIADRSVAENYLRLVINARIGYCKVYRSCFRTFGAEVLGIFVLMIRQFHRNESSRNVRSRGTKVPQERKFSLWTFRSLERKCRGTKRPGITIIVESTILTQPFCVNQAVGDLPRHFHFMGYTQNLTG